MPRPLSEHFVLIASGFTSDPEFRRLYKLLGADDERFATVVGAWLIGLAAARRAKVRDVDVDEESGVVGVNDLLRQVGLLDDTGIPEAQFTKWAAKRQYPSDDRSPVVPEKVPHPPLHTTTQDSTPLHKLHNTPLHKVRSGEVRSGEGTLLENGIEKNPKRAENLPKGTVPVRTSPSREVTLSKEQYEAWKSFTNPEYRAFKAAWLARGFLFPPQGRPGDDDGESLRGMVWQMARDFPESLGRWVTEAPGKTPHEVISHCLRRFHELRTDDDDDDEPTYEPLTRGEAASSLRSILEGMAR